MEFGWIAAAELIFRLAGKYSANVWFGDRVCLRSATFVGQPATLKCGPKRYFWGLVSIGGDAKWDSPSLSSLQY